MILCITLIINVSLLDNVIQTLHNTFVALDVYLRCLRHFRQEGYATAVASSNGYSLLIFFLDSSLLTSTKVVIVKD